jgi:hypothetical protein
VLISLLIYTDPGVVGFKELIRQVLERVRLLAAVILR